MAPWKPDQFAREATGRFYKKFENPSRIFLRVKVLNLISGH
jgi:hypothetical protein